MSRKNLVIKDKRLTAVEVLAIQQYQLGDLAEANHFIKVNFKGGLSEAECKEKLLMVFRKHAILKSRVIEKSGSYYFKHDVRFSDVPILFDCAAAIEQVKKFIYFEEKTSMEVSRYLWRFYLFGLGDDQYLFWLSLHPVCLSHLDLQDFQQELMAEIFSKPRASETELSTVKQKKHSSAWHLFLDNQSTRG